MDTVDKAHLPIEAITPPINVPHAAPNGAPRPKAAKATVLAGSCWKVTPTIPKPAGDATARPSPQIARRTQRPILFLMTAEMIEKTQKVDNPPRYNHFLPNKSASRPAKRSPLWISTTQRYH